MADPERGLVVAVTGPTGTFGAGLIPLLEAEDAVARVVGIARRAFDPAAKGWTKMAYRRGDVRNPDDLRAAFAGADVVVHLAFLITGTAARDTIRTINVEGTLNAFRAAAAAGVRRFVYASSVAAYGFHTDNPVGMTEDWPVRPATRLFYAQEKAELEKLLAEESAGHPDMGLYVLRPPIVVGPDFLGAKQFLPGPLAPVGRWLATRMGRLRTRSGAVLVPVLVPRMSLQLIHEDDVGQALLLCVLGAGPPGAYNIAGDGLVELADIARAFGVVPIPLPETPVRVVARAVAGLPFLPAAAEWVEAAAHPAIMDTAKARTELGWKPVHTAAEALRDTLHGSDPE